MTIQEEQRQCIRTLPYNILAEQMLLGTLLVDNEALLKVADFLEADHFFDPAHKKIYAMIGTCLEKGMVANSITLKTHFDNDEALQNRGGAQYLADLSALSATIININHYGRTIYDLALRRQLITIGHEITNDAFETDQVLSAQEQIDIAEQKLFNISSNYSERNQGLFPVNRSLHEVMNEYEHALRDKGAFAGTPTNFIDLDLLLRGLQNSDLIVIAGRPSMGKTALALNIALNVAMNFQNHSPDSVRKTVGFFSLEMSSKQLTGRLLAILSGISASNMRWGSANVAEFELAMNASSALKDLPLLIDDTASISIASLRTRARRAKLRHNLGILFVAYLQLIRPTNTNNRDQNRVQEISEITQALKAIAKELQIPVVALSQLSRAVEQREDKRPVLADLRESGSIEQDADIVMFLYREEYYLKRKEPAVVGTDSYKGWLHEMNQVTGTCEIIVSKHRNGPVGNVMLHFDPNLTKFSNLRNSKFFDR